METISPDDEEKILEYNDTIGNGILKIRIYNNSLFFIYYEQNEKRDIYFYDFKLNFAKENFRYFAGLKDLEEFFYSIKEILSTIKIEKKEGLITLYLTAHLYGKDEQIKFDLLKTNIEKIPTLIRLSEAENLIMKKDDEIKELKEKINTIEKDNIELNKRVNQLENIINSTVPIFRLYGHGEHFYCSRETEKDNACRGGYSLEGVEFYAFQNQNKI